VCGVGASNKVDVCNGPSMWSDGRQSSSDTTQNNVKRLLHATKLLPS